MQLLLNLRQMSRAQADDRPHPTNRLGLAVFLPTATLFSVVIYGKSKSVEAIAVCPDYI